MKPFRHDPTMRSNAGREDRSAMQIQTRAMSAPIMQLQFSRHPEARPSNPLRIRECPQGRGI
jgi:hypothetical protein